VTVFLLDVNVLIALIDPAHVQHDQAHDWFTRRGQKAFATCPITENGLLRIVGHPRYPNTPGTPSAVAELLKTLRTLPGHHFWPDDISLVDANFVNTTLLSSHSQTTDTYLLALAKAHNGRLASMDSRLVTSAISSGDKILELI
jgi:toxin-antitoxin system PIN domain toxin